MNRFFFTILISFILVGCATKNVDGPNLATEVPLSVPQNIAFNLVNGGTLHKPHAMLGLDELSNARFERVGKGRSMLYLPPGDTSLKFKYQFNGWNEVTHSEYITLRFRAEIGKRYEMKYKVFGTSSFIPWVEEITPEATTVVSDNKEKIEIMKPLLELNAED